MIQICLMDERNYILGYKDFKHTDKEGITNYIQLSLNMRTVNKIELKKYEEK